MFTLVAHVKYKNEKQCQTKERLSKLYDTWNNMQVLKIVLATDVLRSRENGFNKLNEETSCYIILNLLMAEYKSIQSTWRVIWQYLFEQSL